MKPTEQFITRLQLLKEGDLGLLRKYANCPLDETVPGFDLFTGLWWPLRQKSQRAPQREVAWLVTKLYASRPVPQLKNRTLACQMGRLRPAFKKGDPARDRFTERFDRMLGLSLGELEPILRQFLDQICQGQKEPSLDWVQLTDDLSKWEKESPRLKWAEEFSTHSKGTKQC